MAVTNEHDVGIDSVGDVLNVVIDAGSKKGDGFSSEIVTVDFDVVVNGENVHKNYVVKRDPGGDKGEMLKTVRLETVRPEKNRKCLLKLPKNDITRKIMDFDTFTKIALECGRFGQINWCQRL